MDYGTQVYGKPLKLAGRDEIVGFLRDKLGPDMITVHSRAGQPEITVDGGHGAGHLVVRGHGDLRRSTGS